MKFRFPLGGVHKGFATTGQPSNTTPRASNVRPYDPLDDRARGGQRPGYDKWGNGDQVGGADQPVAAMTVI